jgi:murein L,D-transpeptidase YafK
MAIRISYPHDADIKAFLSRRERPGGNIAIHGIRSPFGWLGTWHSLVNWTRGCIAVTNEEIEELARVIPEGTPIEIRP